VAAARSASAQTQGQLSISMAVQPSISIVFNNTAAVGTAGNCALASAGTSNVGLDLGTASFTGGDSLACVAFSKPTGSTYQVASAFNVVVTSANSTSTGYTLRAQISSAPPANVAWMISGTTLLSASPATLDTAATYAANNTKTVQVQVKNSVPAQTLQETITFMATAN
jgi:hypothetical protein